MSPTPDRLLTPRARLVQLGILVVLLIGLSTLLVPLVLAADPGDLDPTFSGDGIVTTTIGSTAIGYGVALQPDGKIVVAGDSNSGGPTGFALVRYTPSGDLDPSFGTGGVVTTAMGIFASGKALAVQPDGKIVVAGDSASSGITHFALARYSAAGALDAGFGSGGLVTTTIGPSAIGWSVVLQADGKIVVAGESTSGGPYGFALARYTAAGSLDASFGMGGVVTTSIDTFAVGRSVALQPDGKILVTGYSGDMSGPFDFALARYTLAGDPDPSFGTGGVVTTSIGVLDLGYDLILQPDGKIVVVGQSDAGGPNGFTLVRYTPAGALDPTFGAGGVVTTTIGPNGFGRSVTSQPDGKIVVAGFSGPGGAFDFALARYTPAGALDPTFGSGGVVTSSISTLDFGRSVALQPDGKIVVAGDSGDAGGAFDFALARYAADFFTYLPTILK